MNTAPASNASTTAASGESARSHARFEARLSVDAAASGAGVAVTLPTPTPRWRSESGTRSRWRSVSSILAPRWRSGSATRSRRRSRAAPGHPESERALIGVARTGLVHQAALVNHEDPVAERQDLGQLRGDEQYRPSRVTLAQQALVEERDRAQVDAAGRVSGQDHRRAAGQLARGDQLLLVAARELARGERGIGRPDVELREQRSAARRQGTGGEQRAGCETRIALAPEQQV